MVFGVRNDELGVMTDPKDGSNLIRGTPTNYQGRWHLLGEWLSTAKPDVRHRGVNFYSTSAGGGVSICIVELLHIAHASLESPNDPYSRPDPVGSFWTPAGEYLMHRTVAHFLN